MGLLRDIFGGKEHCAKLDDKQLLDHLAELTRTADYVFYSGGILSMLNVARDRVEANSEEHAVLIRVCEAMDDMEQRHPEEYSIGTIAGALSRYNHEYPGKPWQSLKL